MEIKRNAIALYFQDFTIPKIILWDTSISCNNWPFFNSVKYFIYYIGAILIPFEDKNTRISERVISSNLPCI